MKILNNVSFKDKTTMGIGGQIPYFIEINLNQDFFDAIKFIKENKLYYFILGEGSNTIGIDKKKELAIIHPVNNEIIYHIDDKEFGFKFPTQIHYNDYYNINICLEMLELIQFYSHKDSKKRIRIKASSGINWDYFVFFNLMHGIPQFIALSGIPGKIGSTPIQNVGAYGEEVKNFISEVHTFYIDNKEIKQKTFNNIECKFEYRNSIFKKFINKIYIYEVIFDLVLDREIKIQYPELEKAFKDFKINDYKKEENNLLKNVNNINIDQYYLLRKCVYSLRRKKGMILENNEYKHSVGSFFTNPILTEEEFKKFQSSLISDYQNSLPFFKEGNYYKIPAAWLIEYSGINKGFKFNRNLGISPLHALAIINSGATLKELKDFIKLIQKKVYKKTGIFLEPEPIFIEKFIYKI
jgi:UDP-N-acetylmuramate dehydrogenase